MDCIIQNNWSGNAGRGGGIGCKGGSPTITHCIINNNGTFANGAGIYCRDSSPTITNCSISSNNTSNSGGGIFCYGSSPAITKCKTSGNGAWFGGGGVYCYLSSPVITNCIINNNSDAHSGGGGIYCSSTASSSPIVITNCTIGSNYTGWLGGGIYYEDNSSTIIRIENSILRGDRLIWKSQGVNAPSEMYPPIYPSNSSSIAVTYSDIQGGIQDGYVGIGNINADPLFVNATGHDFHLQSDSPCVDTGISSGAANCGNSFIVSWSLVNGATSYTLQRATDSSFVNATSVYIGSGISYSETGLANGSYYYRVKAMNSCGGRDWENGTMVTVGSFPSAPTIINYPSINCNGSFTVSWLAINEATTYTLQRATDSLFANAVSVYIGSNTSYSEVSLSSGTYYYRVQATNGCGDSGWKNGQAVTIGLPATQTSINYNSSSCNGSLAISWTSSSGATSYVLQRSNSSVFNSVVNVYTGNNLPYNQNGLTAGIYYYRVKAVNSCGSSSWQNGQAVIVGKSAAPASINYSSWNRTGVDTVIWWMPVNRATSYVLQRATSSLFTNATDVYSGNDILYIDILPNGKYWYRVKAVNDCGHSGWRNSGHGIKVSQHPQ